MLLRPEPGSPAGVPGWPLVTFSTAGVNAGLMKPTIRHSLALMQVRPVPSKLLRTMAARWR
jgi:hypothetical protein